MASLKQDQLRQTVEQAKEQTRQHEAYQASLASTRAAIESNRVAKSSARATWLASIFSAIAVFLTFYQMQKGNETDKELNEVKKRVASIYSLMKVQRQIQPTNGPSSYTVSSDSSVRQAAPGSASPATGKK